MLWLRGIRCSGKPPETLCSTYLNNHYLVVCFGMHQVVMMYLFVCVDTASRQNSVRNQKLSRLVYCHRHPYPIASFIIKFRNTRCAFGLERRFVPSKFEDRYLTNHGKDDRIRCGSGPGRK